MSTDYVPRQRKRVARTAHSTSDGSFNLNVHGKGLAGTLHWGLGLPVDPWTRDSTRRHFKSDNDRHLYQRVPWEATAQETKAWAKVLSKALRFIEPDDEWYWFVVAWRDFLATCGGYKAI